MYYTAMTVNGNRATVTRECSAIYRAAVLRRLCASHYVGKALHYANHDASWYVMRRADLRLLTFKRIKLSHDVQDSALFPYAHKYAHKLTQSKRRKARPVTIKRNARRAQAAVYEYMIAELLTVAPDALPGDIRVHPAVTVDGAEYTPGVIRLALKCAYNAAKRATERGGTDTQYAILNDFSRLVSLAMRYDMGLIDWSASCVAINAAAADMGHDAQDMYQTAFVGLYGGYTMQRGAEAGQTLDGLYTSIDADETEIIRAAYLSINALIQSHKTNRAREALTEYIEDGDGADVALVRVFGQILRGSIMWQSTDGDGMTEAESAELGRAINGARALLSPVEKEVMYGLAQGESVRMIAKRCQHKSTRTTADTINRVRSKVAEYIRANAPQFAHIADTAENARKAAEAQAAAELAERKAAEAAAGVEAAPTQEAAEAARKAAQAAAELASKAAQEAAEAAQAVKCNAETTVKTEAAEAARKADNRRKNRGAAARMKAYRARKAAERAQAAAEFAERKTAERAQAAEHRVK